MIKNKLKLYVSIALLLVTLIFGIVGLTGCDSDKAEIEQIYITNNHSPRLTYVEGQDLDLSSGVLTVVIDGQETLVPLTDAAVSVSGYDKNTLGEQTVTVSYNEFTTTFTVKVVARIVAEGFEKQYFIGDTFNATKGKIRIAKDDATTFTVNLNDSKVTLQAFDSTTPGTKTVTVQYSDGTNQYTCSFNVEVYGASNVTIVYPDKKQYYSHDTDIDFAGGYLTVTAGTNGSIVRHVDITKDMVSGFDLSAVTKEHRTTPLSQEITIKYLDKTFKYTIKITYSGVTVINELMETLKSVNLDGDTITLTDAEASAAVEAITEYYKLTNRHKQLVAEEDIHRLVRCAVGKINELYLKELEDKTTLTVKQEGVSFTAEKCEDLESDIATFADANNIINVYAEILRDIKSDFPDLILTGETKVADTIVVISEEIQGNIVDAFNHIIELHKLMSVVEEGDKYPAVPKDWTVDTLANYETTILEVVDIIKRETFMQTGLSGIYNLLSKWREKQDFFDIIYSYYLYSENETYTDDYIKENILSKMPLPTVVGQWYSYWYNASYIAQLLSANGTKLYLRDVTEYMYYYDLLLEKTEEIIKSETDTLSKDIL
ncbi:MAG: bacterial Ig-like domain-containing protein, partial [Bacteroides sp.]|nr:bacterial Ig-like domain-containing protein [Bacteroides sp.]